MSQQGPILVVATGGRPPFAAALDEAKLFPVVDVDWADAASAVKQLDPGAVLASAPGMDNRSLAELAGRIASCAPYLPLIVIDPQTPLPDNAIPFAHDDDHPERLLARVNSALMLKKEMDCRKLREQELRRSNAELQQALREVKVLKGLVPICASCKKIRNDQGFWQQLEEYIQQHSEAEFSHGLCTPCIKKLYPGVYKD